MWSKPINPTLLLLPLGLSAAVVAAGPCDIYASSGTPCVAAHSTTRALYSAYSGALYQVWRSKDSTVTDIKVVNGIANSAAQDTFCAGTGCLITTIYDQSGRNNHLTQAPPGAFKGPAANGYDNYASATAAPVYLNGHKVYGVYVTPGVGYRNNKATGTAKGDQPQGMYAVFDGTHYSNACCFDYGNAETNSLDTGNGHMEAIYFGSCSNWGSGAGKGPWIMGDLENGMFSGFNVKNNPGDPSITWRFVTAIVKGTANLWAIKGGDATSGLLSTFYNGKRPNASGYNPMSKEGAIILGTGGDNSIGGAGTFYEGIMTYGYPTDAAEDLVQANIVAAKYSTSGSGAATTTKISTSSTTKASTGSCAALYGQCGGIGWAGPTCCTSSTCTYSNAYYSQCL
ncbi:Alpha-N-arabinofuranosidase [Dactylellina cionopaga]|nr:Alpha-N-arabinofuranosidase [Dactylellina cionopaga]